MHRETVTLKTGYHAGRRVVSDTMSLAEFAAATPGNVFYSTSDNTWAGGSIAGVAADLQACGTERHAQAIADAQARIKVPAFRLYGATPALDVGPGVPIIPAVLSGQPDNMLTMSEAADTSTPVRIIVDRTCSSGVDARVLETVGATIAALVNIVQASRPVEVFAVLAEDWNTRENYRDRRPVDACTVRVRLSSNPSMSELGLALASIGFVRRAMFGYLESVHKSYLTWAFDNNGEGRGGNGALEANRAAFADMIGPHDIYVPPLHLHNDLVRDPQAWSEKALARVFGEVETGTADAPPVVNAPPVRTYVEARARAKRRGRW